MSKGNNIDKLVKQKLDGQTPAFQEGQWAAAKSFVQSKKKKKRRALVFWLMGLLLLISSVFVVDHFQNDETGEGIAQADPRANSLEESSNSSRQNSTSNTSDGEGNSMGNSAGENGNTVVNQNGNTISGKGQSSMRSSGTVGLSGTVNADSSRDESGGRSQISGSVGIEGTTGDKRASDKTAADKVGDGPRFSITPKVAVSPIPVIDSTKENSDDKPTSETSSSLKDKGRISISGGVGQVGDKTQNPHITEVPNPESGNSTTTTTKSERIAKVLPNDTAGQEPSLSQRRRPNGEDGNGLRFPDSLLTVEPYDSMLLLKSEVPMLSKSSIDSALDVENRNRRRLPKGFFVIPYIGPSLSQSTLSGENKELLDKRNAEEADPWSLDLGMMARYRFKNQFYVGSGLGYFEVGENADYKGFSKRERFYETEFSHKITDTNYTLEYTSWDTIYFPFEQLVYTGYRMVEDYDSVSIRTPVPNDSTIIIAPLKVKNRFKYLEVPLVFGYQMPIGKNWTIGADAGTSFNFLVSANGSYPDIENTRFRPMASSQYKFLNYSFISNVTVGRSLGKHWLVNGNIRYRTQLSPSEKANATLQSRYQSFGFLGRLSYKF